MQHWLMWVANTSIARDFDRLDFSFKGALRFKMARGDVIVLLVGWGEGAKFRQYGMVAEVAKEERDNHAMFHVRVEEWKNLPPDNDLDSLRYSLTFIANPANPLRSLRNSCRKVSSEDFETIRRGDIFLARAAYFEFFNALHSDMQVEFEAEERIGSSGKWAQWRFLERLKRLDQFIQERVLSVGKTLEALSAAASSLELQYDGSSVQHVFADDTGEGAMFQRNYHDIARQTSLFAELQAALNPEGGDERIAKPHSLVDQILMKSTESWEDRASQTRLENIFRGK